MDKFAKTAIFIVLATTALACCAKTETEETPLLAVGEITTVSSDGTTDGRFTLSIEKQGGNIVKTMPDGKIVTAASFDPATGEVGFAMAENTGMKRSGYVVVSCGSAAEVVYIPQRQGTILKYKTGWYELPELTENDDYIYYSHKSLPSAPERRNYSFCFAPDKFASMWVAYPLHKCYLGNADRRNSFGYDRDFAEFSEDGDCSWQAQVTGAYYTEYGNTTVSSTNLQYSRGHQLPSADRTCSSEDNDTSFYSTNMTPQLQTLNGGAWQGLETLARERWICSDTLYVVTGALFEPGHAQAYDNKSKGKCVPVPTHYWKVVLRTCNGASGRSVAECSASELKCIGFVFAHDKSRGSQKIYKSDARTVEQIEQMTGFEFFANVPAAPKSTCDPSQWEGLVD